MKYYAIQKEEAKNEAHIYIFGDIVTWAYFEDETSGYSLANDIKNLDVDCIHVHIDSYGGAVSEGWAIYNTLKQHKAKIITYADGFVASAAIYPFLAGDERVASNLSAFYFHQVLTSVYGNADDLRAAADEVETLNEIGLAAFENVGVDKDAIRELEKKETWLSASDALTLGIATSVVKGEDASCCQSARKAIIQKLMQASAPAATHAEKPAEEPAQKNKEEKTPERSLMQFLSGIFM